MCYYMIEQISNYATKIQIPYELKILDSFLVIFSQILSIQFQEIMGGKVLVISQLCDRYVTEVSVEAINAE